jgi:hypothetical protein
MDAPEGGAQLYHPPAQGRPATTQIESESMADTKKQPGPSEAERTRRSFLHAGFAGGIGLLFGDLLPVQALANGPRRDAPAKALIQVCLAGGLSHVDSFDPKPAAGSAYQGGLGTVQTRLSGVVFGELLKQTAAVADRLTVCRSLTHDQESHGGALHYLFTGSAPTEGLAFPSVGSVVAQVLGVRNNLPPYILIPGHPSLHADGGPLGRAAAPFILARNPADQDYKAENVIMPWDYEKDASASAAERIDTRSARRAFDILSEPASVRDEYGRHLPGQGLLLARRLVAAGVRVATVSMGGWDMHVGLKQQLTRRLATLDQALAALVRDLERTGLFDSTLVLVTTEFGRSPKVNKYGGRDHCPRVFSAVLAGAGVKKGYVVGASDATASEPRDNPLPPEDLAATVYHLLGIDAATRIQTADNRSLEIVRGGKVRKELLA